MFKIIYTFIFFILVSSLTLEDITQKGIVVIQPSAFISMRHYFDRMVIFSHSSQNSQYLDGFIQQALQLNTTINDTNILFGVINIEEDVTGVLTQLNLVPGIHLVTERNIYFLQSQKYLTLESFYQQTVKPKLLVVKEAIKDQHFNTLVFSFPNASSYRGFEHMYHILKQDLQQFDTKCVSVQTPQLSIQLILKSGQRINYQSDPADLLQVTKFVNLETISLISNLEDDKTLRRVFGAGVQTQLLAIINESLSETDKNLILKTLQQVAQYNKNDQLKYQRVLFAVAPTHYVHDLMSDIIEDLQNSKFKILMTRTNYQAFALQRFLYQQNQLTVDSLKTFIEDFRLKKLKPFYRSQPTPGTQPNTIIKVVGKTFNQVVYGNKQNVLILFYDSKDPYSFKDWKSILSNFVQKYKTYFNNQLIVGEFDLALNQHENLYLKYAPQLHLFSKKNKKQPFRFEGEFTLETLKDFVIHGASQLTFPDNVEKPLALGGGLPVGGSQNKQEEL